MAKIKVSLAVTDECHFQDIMPGEAFTYTNRLLDVHEHPYIKTDKGALDITNWNHETSFSHLAVVKRLGAKLILGIKDGED